jgi:hypothetical protein
VSTGAAPSFPVDEETLALLETSISPDGETAEVSSLGSFLEFMGQLGGLGPDEAYHHHDVIRALVAEVRRLRAAP